MSISKFGKIRVASVESTDPDATIPVGEPGSTPATITAAAVITAATDVTAAKLTDTQALRTKVNELVTELNAVNTLLVAFGIRSEGA